MISCKGTWSAVVILDTNSDCQTRSWIQFQDYHRFLGIIKALLLFWPYFELVFSFLKHCSDNAKKLLLKIWG